MWSIMKNSSCALIEEFLNVCATIELVGKGPNLLSIIHDIYYLKLLKHLKPCQVIISRLLL